MSRPLVISDCDEVLLHMVVPFADWLREAEGIDFSLVGNDFAGAMRWQKTASPPNTVRRWRWRTTPRVRCRCLKPPVSRDGAVNRKYRPFVVW